MKPANLILLAAIIPLAFLSGCKPNPITGQVFIVTEAGVNFPLGAVEVEMVSGKDAGDFMQHRQLEIKDKILTLQKAYDEAKTNCDAAEQANSKAQTATATAKMNEAWTNEPQYVTLLNEKAKDLQTIETLTRAIEYLRPQANPSWGRIQFATSPADQQKQIEAIGAIQEDTKRCSSLTARGYEIDRECYSIQVSFLVPFGNAEFNTENTLAQEQAKLNDAATALKDFPTPSDYFDPFSPVPIEISVTDADGNFTIQKPEKGAKIFAKAQRQVLDSVENYFWLVDLPANGQKIILSNNNLFVPPTGN